MHSFQNASAGRATSVMQNMFRKVEIGLRNGVEDSGTQQLLFSPFNQRHSPAQWFSHFLEKPFVSLIKVYRASVEGETRYSPAEVVSTEVVPVEGAPDTASPALTGVDSEPSEILLLDLA